MQDSVVTTLCNSWPLALCFCCLVIVNSLSRSPVLLLVIDTLKWPAAMCGMFYMAPDESKDSLTKGVGSMMESFGSFMEGLPDVIKTWFFRSLVVIVAVMICGTILDGLGIHVRGQAHREAQLTARVQAEWNGRERLTRADWEGRERANRALPAPKEEPCVIS